MKNVYVVMGTTGEYSDRNEWAVMAYLDEAAAQEHVVNADRRAKELFATRPDRYSIEKGANEFDPDMSMDYTGTSYFIYTVPLAKKSGLTKRALDGASRAEN
jgi:hypothetical protein